MLFRSSGVAGVRPYIEGMTYLDRPGTAYDEHVFVLDVPTLTSTTRLSAGRLPEAAGEVAVSSLFAQNQNLGVGDAASFIKDPTDDTASPTTATIVGIIEPGPKRPGKARRTPTSSPPPTITIKKF